MKKTIYDSKHTSVVKMREREREREREIDHHKVKWMYIIIIIIIIVLRSSQYHILLTVCRRTFCCCWREWFRIGDWPEYNSTDVSFCCCCCFWSMCIEEKQSNRCCCWSMCTEEKTISPKNSYISDRFWNKTKRIPIGTATKVPLSTTIYCLI